MCERAEKNKCLLHVSQASISILRAKAVAANHVSATQLVIVTSCVIRLLLACVTYIHVLRHGKLPYDTPTFILFYFILFQMCGRISVVRTSKIK